MDPAIIVETMMAAIAQFAVTAGLFFAGMAWFGTWTWVVAMLIALAGFVVITWLAARGRLGRAMLVADIGSGPSLSTPEFDVDLDVRCLATLELGDGVTHETARDRYDARLRRQGWAHEGRGVYAREGYHVVVEPPAETGPSSLRLTITSPHEWRGFAGPGTFALSLDEC